MEKNGWFVHVEWVVVLVTLLGGFYLLDGKIERSHERIDTMASQQAERSDRLYEMFIQMNTRVARMEGGIYGKKVYDSVDED